MGESDCRCRPPPPSPALGEAGDGEGRGKEGRGRAGIAFPMPIFITSNRPVFAAVGVIRYGSAVPLRVANRGWKGWTTQS